MSFLKSIWKANQKHKKLSEELALQITKENAELDQAEELEDDKVITFKLKYLGSTVVEKITGDSISTESVKNIIKTAKASRKKLQRVNVNVSVNGISVCDLQGNDILKVSIYRISNCSTDQTHKEIFSFISTDEDETMECHAFICQKRKIAETVTLAVAHAFSAAYEYWRLLPNTKDVQKNATNIIKNDTKPKTEVVNSEIKQIHPAAKQEVMKPVVEDILIDFDTDVKVQQQNDLHFFSNDFNEKWVCFDDDFVVPQNKF